MDYEEFQEHTPPTWQPKCIVVSLAVKSRAELRDQLVEQGRILVHPLRLALNYTTTTSENPDHEIASVNCALGRELEKLHTYDKAGQELTDKYLALKSDLETARKQFQVFNKIYMGLSAYRPPISPPPPSAPPMPLNTPPAAPEQVSLGVRNDQLRQRVEDLEIEVDKAAAAVESCIPSKYNICGRSSIAAPDPWISASGRPCAGNATREAIEGFYCGYWGSPVSRHVPFFSSLFPCATRCQPCYCVFSFVLLPCFFVAGQSGCSGLGSGGGAAQRRRSSVLLCGHGRGAQVPRHRRPNQPSGSLRIAGIQTSSRILPFFHFEKKRF